MADIQEQLEKSLARLLDRVGSKINRANIKAIDLWIDFLKASGANAKTALKYSRIPYAFLASVLSSRLK